MDNNPLKLQDSVCAFTFVSRAAITGISLPEHGKAIKYYYITVNIEISAAIKFQQYSAPVPNVCSYPKPTSVFALKPVPKYVTAETWKIVKCRYFTAPKISTSTASGIQDVVIFAYLVTVGSM